jgi:hypothetical protein
MSPAPGSPSPAETRSCKPEWQPPRGTPAGSRELTCRDQLILALRWFRDRSRIEVLGRDHGISRTTAYRYVAEAVDVLSEQSPGLAEALEGAMAEGVPYVILDGKVF